ncbi:MAG: hypothetical protein AB8B50_07855 [Pirellulaceae bacterium]
MRTSSALRISSEFRSPGRSVFLRRTALNGLSARSGLSVGLALVFAIFYLAPAQAQVELDSEKDAEEGSKDEIVEFEVIAEGLNNPCGVAIQPETGTVFVADSGNQRVVRVEGGNLVEVITDFPKDVYGKGPKVNIGPLGLAFLSKSTLLVGGGGLPDGEELLRVFELSDDTSPITAGQMEASFSLSATESRPGEGNFYALAATPNGVYVTCNGDDEKGWVSRVSIEEGKPSAFGRYLATKEATGVNAPVGATISPDGYLVVGQMGAIDTPGDSLLTFYDEGSKSVLLNLETGLDDICAVAYSTGRIQRMYVLDYAWSDPGQGGLFKIVEDPASESGMRAERVVSLDKPTSMAFGLGGELFITVRGATEEGDSSGQLLRIPSEAGL